jgi:SAM-dependent methyltransferase
MKDSKAYYDSISDVYNKQSKKRIEYLNAVDQIIINECKTRDFSTYLDIGAGNGRRSLRIAKTLNIKKTTLLDNSTKMLENLSTLNDIQAIDTSIFDFKTTEKFDLITCLWNVVGHFPSKKYMELFFKKSSELLYDNGCLFFDVNNRYNISHYGNKSVMENLRKDALNIEDAGWYTTGDNENKTKVYIHSPFEIDDYLSGLDLFLEKTHYVDYKNGAMKETFFEGQLLYKLVKKTI